MKKERSKRCPKCGCKTKDCRCNSWKKKVFFLPLAIIVITIAGYGFQQGRLNYYSKPFYEALNSLPNEQIKADYHDLLDNEKLRISLVTGQMNQAAQYDKQNNILEISLRQFKSDPKEKLWCVLVHEHAHIYKDRQISDAEAQLLTLEQGANLVWDDEYQAYYQETLFAQTHNFLSQTDPDIINSMASLQIDLETAVAASLFRNLMQLQFAPYDPLKPYFPKIFMQKIKPQYRDKFRIGGQS